MKIQAYLGPNSPETVAEAFIPDLGIRPNYAVVVWSRDANPGDRGVIANVHSHYGPACLSVARQTTHKQYAVLCQVRNADLPARAEAGVGSDA